MKKIILIIAFIGISILSKAQCNLPYKPFSAFGKDTVAFITYNFMDRADCHKGKTIKEIEKDLQMPIIRYNYFTDLKTGNILGLYIYTYDNKRFAYLLSKGLNKNGIKIYWDNKTGVDEKIVELRKKNKYWGKEISEICKNLKIKYIEIPDQKKVKSTNDDEFTPFIPSDFN
ncbi:hypothetical protein [Dysgonomonas sp.]